MLKKFPVTSHDLPTAEILTSIREFLSSLKISPKELNRTALMCEESVNLLLEHAQPGTAKLYLRKVLGTVSIEVSIPGQEFAFTEDFSPLSVETDDDEAKAALQTLLLRSFGDRVSFKRRNGRNSVRITAQKSPYSFLYQTLSAIVLAVLCGVVCRNFVPESVYSALNYAFLEPVRTMFMSALKIVIAPIVFFSLVNSVSQFGGVSDIGKTGGKFMVVFLMMELLGCVAAGLVFYGAGALGFPFTRLAGALSETVQASGTEWSIRDVIVNIVPSNFVRPFLQSDMLQLMFLGIICGISVGMIGDYSKPLTDMFKACNELFMKMTSILTKFIPFAVLCSIWSMVLTAGAGLLFSLAGIIFIVLAGLAVLMVVDCVRLKMSGLSVVKFVRKYSPAMAHVLSTTSSVASLPENMKAADSLGIPQKIYSFALPLGVIFSKNGSIFYRALTALFMAEVFGVDVSFWVMVSVLVSAAVITLSTPGVPGGAYIAFSALLAQMGVPAEALACIIGVDAVMDIFIAVVNSFGVMVSSLTISKAEGSLNISRCNS